MDFTSRVEQYIRRHELMSEGFTIVVACSGGPDSTALLHCLHLLSNSWKLELLVAHINYGLRGAEADRDEQHVRRLCHELKLPFELHRVPPEKYKNEAGSTQMVCRRIRFSYLEELRTRFQAQRIALGHTLDDAMETFYLRIFSGSGLAGLKGMQPLSRNVYIRPFLRTTRQEIMVFLHEGNRPYMIDSSNLKTDYSRNAIRHQLIPFITGNFCSHLSTAMDRTMEILRQEDEYLAGEVELIKRYVVIEEKDGIRLDRRKMRKLHPALHRRIIMAVCYELHGEHSPPRNIFRLTEELLYPAGNEDLALSRDISDDIHLCADSDWIIFTRRTHETPRPVTPLTALLTIPGRVFWPAAGMVIEAIVLNRDVLDKTPPTRMIKDRVIFDRAGLPDVLTVRTRKTGDRFFPFGGPGSISLKKYLINEKVDLSKRDRLPLVLADDEIIWVVGFRRGRRAAVNEATDTVVVLTLTAEAGSNEETPSFNHGHGKRTY